MLVHKNKSPVNPNRVVILGAGGFLAPELARLLEANGIAVRAIGSKALDLTAEGAADGLVSELLDGDVVVMAAGLTPDKGRDIGTLMKNLRMAENVCGALGRVKPAQFVYISSDGVYDARFSSLLNEESTCEPTDLYNLMHTAREKMLGQACHAASVPLAIVRPCAIYGPGDTHNSYGPNRFIRTARKDGKITLFGGGEESRHHVFFEDVAKIVMLCVLHGSSGIINAITGKAVSFREVAEMIIAAGNREVALECLPRGTPVTHRNFDLTGLVRAFPDFSATPLAVGIARTVAQS